MKKIRVCLKKLYRNLTLIYIWVTRIFMVKSHFKVPFYIKIWMNINGYLADQYVLYDLKHNKMLDFLSEFDWYKSRYINGDYRFLLDNKLVCNGILEKNICVPRILAIKADEVLTNEFGTVIDYTESLFLVRKYRKTFLKKINSGKGNGVFQLAYSSKTKGYTLDGKNICECDIIDMLKRTKNYFISECVEQSDFLGHYYEHTENTIRLVTLRNPETGTVIPFFAVLRIGTNKSYPVDNASRGGIVAKIDMQTGTLGYARSLFSTECYSSHPDTGVLIAGTTIPKWVDIRDKICELAEKFSYLKLIAWDVLITEKKVYVIEANASTGVNILQLWDGQRNSSLGDIFRHYGIIKR